MGTGEHTWKQIEGRVPRVREQGRGKGYGIEMIQSTGVGDRARLGISCFQKRSLMVIRSVAVNLRHSSGIEVAF